MRGTIASVGRAAGAGSAVGFAWIESHTETEATVRGKSGTGADSRKIASRPREFRFEPHFLFNALSAVLACRHDPDAVEEVTSALSDYLRFCLSRGNNTEPLADELDAVEQLLIVQKARVAADRLVIEVANSGQWVEPDPARPGSGLANLRRRLELRGIDHTLNFEAEGGLVTARLSLPLLSA